MQRYLAFDIEIAKVLPDEFEDWRRYRPLGVSCAATLASDGQLTLWHGKTPEGGIADQMTPSELAELVGHLQAMADSGFTILTWNGLGFDLAVLAEESGLSATCRTLAMTHVDMMFHVFCLLGYPLGLDRAAKGMLLTGKTPGMTGSLAPKAWAEGRRQEVLDYVAQDVRITLALAESVEKQRGLRWISRNGKEQFVPIKKWLAVQEARTLPLPDTSWMKAPWSRDKFLDWTK